MTSNFAVERTQGLYRKREMVFNFVKYMNDIFVPVIHVCKLRERYGFEYDRDIENNKTDVRFY